jgi:hypothetical protein
LSYRFKHYKQLKLTEDDNVRQQTPTGLIPPLPRYHLQGQDLKYRVHTGRNRCLILVLNLLISRLDSFVGKCMHTTNLLQMILENQVASFPLGNEDAI